MSSQNAASNDVGRHVASTSHVPAIIVHGGAWAIPDHLAVASVQGVRGAAIRGWGVLQEGGSALDAVEAAVRVMEDDVAFDAGKGSVLNLDGDVEMDACIMAGDLRAGSVASVHNIANPISLARLIMEKTDHVMVVGTGADKLAVELGVQHVPSDQLVTSAAREELERLRKFKVTVGTLFNHQPQFGVPGDTVGHDTVGAAVVDTMGHVASGTSTGGITAKRPGRVGDTPIIGAGGYAEDGVGAASTTGHGEAIIKVCLAKRVVDLMDQGLTAQQAVERGVEEMRRKTGSCGGVVAISKGGNPGHYFSTARMAWAYVQGGQLHYGLNPGEDFIEDLEQQ